MTEGNPIEGTSSRRWLANYPPGTPHHIDETSTRTLVDLFDESRRAYGTRPLMDSFGVSMSYGETGEVVDAIAAFLQASGVNKGDRIAIMLPNVAAYLPIIFGALKAGAVVVNTNPLYTPRELLHQMKDSGARVIFFLSLFEDTVVAADKELHFGKAIRVEVGDLLGLKGRLVSFVAKRKAGGGAGNRVENAISFKEALATGRRQKFKPVDVFHNDVAFLQYTGGTTGVSKGATLLHSNVRANVEQCTQWFAPVLDLAKSKHTMVAALPLYHIFGLTACAFFMVNIGGCAMLITNPRDLKSFVQTLKKRRFTVMAGVNTLFNALADNPSFASLDFSKLRLCVAGGMATKSAVAERWRKVTGKPIIEGYGLSETSPGVTFNRPDIDSFSGTIGYPWPSTEVEIRATDGTTLPQGESGEICVRGPQVMAGYWNRPEETAAAFWPDGFFRTGDMGMMLEDGQVKLVDRLKELIIVSGFNVYPNEVEDTIAALPQVQDVAVIGMPDEHSGEVVAAFVVKRDPSLSEADVREHCKRALTGYKIPKYVYFRDDLPKSNVGKVLRRVLRDEVVKA